jgi:hypothetical protein
VRFSWRLVYLPVRGSDERTTLRQDIKSLGAGGFSEVTVEGDEGEGTGIVFRGDDRRRELDRISGSESVPANKIERNLADSVEVIDF